MKKNSMSVNLPPRNAVWLTLYKLGHIKARKIKIRFFSGRI